MNLLPFLVLTIDLLVLPSGEIVTQFHAVNSRTSTVKTLYKRAKDAYQQNSLLEKEFLDPEAKNDICSSIMAHSIEFIADTLKSMGEVAELINTVGRRLSTDDLSHLDREILLYHVAKTTFLSIQFMKHRRFIKTRFIFTPGDVIKNEDSTQLMVVYDYNLKPDLEYVFTCTKQIDESDIEIFFVSKEYNVNFFSDFLTNPIAARFIFSGDKCLLAIAEEPAAVVSSYSQKSIEKLYLDRRREKQPANSASEDPICQLQEDEKFRLCGLIFNSEYIRERFKIRFPASYSVIRDYECQMKTVSFVEELTEPKTGYQEWVALCYMSYVPFSHNPDPNLTYYVSRAYNPDTTNTISTNDVFLYKENNHEQMHLINTFTNIRKNKHIFLLALHITNLLTKM